MEELRNQVLDPVAQLEPSWKLFLIRRVDNCGKTPLPKYFLVMEFINIRKVKGIKRHPEVHRQKYITKSKVFSRLYIARSHTSNYETNRRWRYIKRAKQAKHDIEIGNIDCITEIQ